MNSRVGPENDSLAPYVPVHPAGVVTVTFDLPRRSHDDVDRYTDPRECGLYQPPTVVPVAHPLHFDRDVVIAVGTRVASSGVFLRKFGGKGEGPGEYIYFRRISRYPGDSIFVVDHEGLRAHVVAPDGRHVRTFRPRLANDEGVIASAPTLLGVFSDGTLLVAESLGGCAARRPGEDDGYCENSSSVYQLREDGSAGMHYGKFLSGRVLSATTASGERLGFGIVFPYQFIRVSGEHFYYADGAKPEIRVFHRERGLTRIIRMADTRVPMRPGLAALPPPPPEVVARRIASGTASEAERAKVYATLDVPKFARYFAAMQIDLDGNIWLEDAGPEPLLPPTGINRWWVFDSSGALLTKVKTPSRARPGSNLFWGGGAEVGRDHILVRGVNSDGADVVRLHRLRKR